eukprot:s3614_g7.t2
MVLNQRGGRRHLSLWSHFSLRAKPSFGKGVASQPRSGPAPPSAGSAPEGIGKLHPPYTNLPKLACEQVVRTLAPVNEGVGSFSTKAGTGHGAIAAPRSADWLRCFTAVP